MLPILMSRLLAMSVAWLGVSEKGNWKMITMEAQYRGVYFGRGVVLYTPDQIP